MISVSITDFSAKSLRTTSELESISVGQAKCQMRVAKERAESHFSRSRRLFSRSGGGCDIESRTEEAHI